jgi:hypothetical protein
MQVDQKALTQFMKKQDEILREVRILKDKIEENDRLLNAREAAEFLQLNYVWFMNSAAKNIPAIRKGRRVYFKKGELKKYRDGE